MNAAHQLGQTVGRAAACRALNVPRASLYRHLRPAGEQAESSAPRPSPPRALSPEERQQVLDVLHEERFRDKAPPEVFTTLLDEGRYLCSLRTMYRILEESGEVHERRDQLRHPSYQKPQLLATAPNQVWSWEITKLLGPVKWTYFYLYVILDIFSRYVVGWMVAERESAELAKRLIAETCRKQNIGPSQLTIHADRGTSMTSQPVALLLADLGVTKTHSRPHVSDDNPFSESQFKTLKYRRSSPIVSAPFRTPAPSAKSSSPGTTPNTITAASACSPPRPFTMAGPTTSSANARWCSPKLSKGIPNASSAPIPNRRPNPLRSGSIRRPSGRQASRSNTNSFLTTVLPIPAIGLPGCGSFEDAGKVGIGHGPGLLA